MERARALAAAAAPPGYEVLQYQHSHLRPRFDVPGDFSPDGSLGHAGPELLGYLRSEPALTLVAYSPSWPAPTTATTSRCPRTTTTRAPPARLAVLRDIARETGATVGQVVLAWQIGAELPIVPLAGASSVAQLEANLAAVDLDLTPEQRTRLDTVH
ncbi:aldo/keto reductase [Streptomyces thinghirensis]|nr:aldo/keto reductase [Streptomyces thinghirensis]